MRVAIQPAPANGATRYYPRPRLPKRRKPLRSLLRPPVPPNLDPDLHHLPRLDRADCEPGYLFQLCGGGRRVIRVPSTY